MLSCIDLVHLPSPCLAHQSSWPCPSDRQPSCQLPAKVTSVRIRCGEPDRARGFEGHGGRWSHMTNRLDTKTSNQHPTSEITTCPLVSKITLETRTSCFRSGSPGLDIFTLRKQVSRQGTPLGTALGRVRCWKSSQDSWNDDLTLGGYVSLGHRNFTEVPTGTQFRSRQKWLHGATRKIHRMSVNQPKPSGV